MRGEGRRYRRWSRVEKLEIMDAKEFEKEYRRLLLPLGMYSLRMVMNVSESEDIVQNVFINTWNMIQSGNTPDNLKSYLYRAVRNASLRFLDKEERDPFEDIESAEDVTDEEIDTSERDARLWKAIEELPDKCRQVFLLCKRDGLTYQQTADTMGVSIKTVENHIHRAMKSLRQAYGIKDKSVTIPIFFLPLI